MNTPPTPDDVLQFWFDDADQDPTKLPACLQRWFDSSPEFDREIRSRFGHLVEAAARREIEWWRHQAPGCMAYILVCDQFPRNIFRGTPKAFSLDDAALEACLVGIDAGLDQALSPVGRGFFYLPLEHAEDPGIQERSVASFEALAAHPDPRFSGMTANYLIYARQHRDIVAQFGRFPHRNAILGRTSTPEEEAYLEGGGATFGQ